ncbi:IS110 family transposase [Providencia stuartii]|uniref:IS110 family transposase n=3 Tax=Providencia stuartii TaxID=588 RepID=UPI0004F6C596|nr:IS110 family transposase [Providencia stuartii]ELB2669187.1 IS110 family transposase [Acinetobacter baumannii]AIN62367.1 transposase family protein [Providencia stuartii]AIN64352.1 transposase family protein [Providencia stuartii]AIN64434.1 transposase family protein [Providencia stuartii]AIN64745.1 transposase family protein [Providencia stuartii]
MTVITIGIDLAKNVFQIHGVDENGKCQLKKRLKRSQMTTFFANMKPCLIGMEACAGAHHWARILIAQGHSVKLMPPQFVKPYVKTNKNDMADAEAICEAVSRPNMRFVSIKTSEQQSLLSVHRARTGFVKARTAQINQIRGLLAEFGIVLPQGAVAINRHVPELLEDADNGLPMSFRHLLSSLYKNIKQLSEHIETLEAAINEQFRQDELCKKIAAIPGVGVLTATAIVSTVGDGKGFKNGRQLAAWLGLVPLQHSSGGKNVLGRISKRGDVYIRTLLIHGARSVIVARKHKLLPGSWLSRLLTRRNKNVAAVALANKNARMLWVLLTTDKEFSPDQTIGAVYM